MSSAAIAVRGLRKRYGRLEVLRGINLEIQAGEVFALLGPNGAGKTTTVEILEGFRRREGGEASVLGADPARAGRRWRAQIGIVPQDTGAFEELTVSELVAHFRSFYPDPLGTDQVIGVVGLRDKAGERAAKLSGGQRRRLAIALGIVGNPRLIFLDEPTTGLDPAIRRQTWELIRELAAREVTILLTTHYLDEVEALANRVAVLSGGRIVAEGRPESLGGRASGEAHVSFSLPPMLAGLDLPPGLPGAAVHEGLVTLRTAEPTDAVAKLIVWARQHGVRELPGLSVARPSLEDVYLRLISSGPRRSTAETAPEGALA